MANILPSGVELGHENGQFGQLRGIAVDSSGNVYVTDDGLSILVGNITRIQKFTSEGQFLKKWGTFGTGLGEFYQPYGIAIGPNNDIYVADYGNGRIQKINANDEFTIFAGQGEADGKFEMPKGIAIDAAGNIYVSDTYKYNIQKLSADGQYVTKWGTCWG